MTQEVNRPTFVDDMHAPEYFASTLAGAGFDGPNIHLTFSSFRMNHAGNPSEVKEIVNLRVVMSIDSVLQMNQFLDTFLASRKLLGMEKAPDQSMQ